MIEDDKKLRWEWQWWEKSYNRLVHSNNARVTWLESEAAYISGLIFRVTGRKPVLEDRVLQVGAGPVDVIHFWDSNHRYAIDPLADQYKEKFHDFQDQGVNYVAGVGEDLPYEDDYFDIVIIRNTLDHVYDPGQTLREIHRVLKPRGVVYIWIHLYSRRTSLVYRTINASTKKYEVEPWAFTWDRINRLLKKEGFKPLRPAMERDIWEEDNENSTYSAGSRLKVLLRKILNWFHHTSYTCVAMPIK